MLANNPLKRAVLACVVATCALAALSPASASEAKVSGTVKLAWFGPSGEDVNTAADQQGLLGWSFTVPAAWHGKHFDLTYPGAQQVLLEQYGFKLYAVDLDVYFYNAEGWPQGDGSVRNWDNTTGVNPGPESKNIPAGTDSAFVTISVTSPSAHDVSFEFVVTLS